MSVAIIGINENYEVLSEEDFMKKSDNPNDYFLTSSHDSITYFIKVKRIQKGKISSDLLEKIKNNLSGFSEKSIPNESIFIINYHHGQDECNVTGDQKKKESDFIKFNHKVKKLKNTLDFYLFDSPEGLSENENIRWIKDKDDLIKSTFFPFKYPCGSYVIIDKDGNYYAQKGEYYIFEIFDLLKKKVLLIK